MEKYELSKDWIRKHALLVKKGYSIAIVRKYDIRSSKDVVEILKAIDPANVSEENADIFSQILSLFEHRLKKKTEVKPREKKREIN
jgi:hypothetical protein